MIPIAQAFTSGRLSTIRLVATDMDGTLTHRGKFSANLLQSLEALVKADILVLVVTGRSAGWVNAVQTYLPIAGAIAENGGLYFSSQTPQFLTSIPDPTRHRQKLNQTFQFLKSQFPWLQESADNAFRLTDWTFDVEGLSPTQLQQLSDLCQQQGWSFTYSTVQCHIKPLQQNKACGLLQVLKQHCGQLTDHEIITVGDSPNDQSLFNPGQFPISVGVANVLHYTQQLTYKPAYVTTQAEGNGFDELVQLILDAQ